MDAVWPSGLPYPLKAGYSGSVTPNIIKTPMESGPARIAVVDPLPDIIYSVSLHLNDVEMIAFIHFWRNGLQYGTGWMAMPHYINGVLGIRRCRMVDGAYSHDPSSGINRIGFSVEIQTL